MDRRRNLGFKNYSNFIYMNGREQLQSIPPQGLGQGIPPAHETKRRRPEICYAASATRVSISLRSSPKSIGFVKSPSAPLSNALRFVSASP